MSQLNCPICNKPSEVTFRPFCSQRCQWIDLGNWLSGNYVIAGREASTDKIDEEEMS